MFVKKPNVARMILRSLVVEPLRPSSSLGALGSSPHRDKNLPIKRKKKKKKDPHKWLHMV